MKHITLALATVMLPIASYAYTAVQICRRVIKVDNTQLETNRKKSQDYCSFIIPPGTERVIFHIGLNAGQAKAPVHLLSQIRDKLESGAPIYVVGCMVDSDPSHSSMDISTYDNMACAAMDVRNERDRCMPLISEKGSKGGTYDVQIQPAPYAGEYYICFKNKSKQPQCYATVEAVAIIH